MHIPKKSNAISEKMDLNLSSVQTSGKNPALYQVLSADVTVCIVQ